MIRLAVSEDEEEEFEGFFNEELDRREPLSRKVKFLKEQQAIMDEMMLAEPCSGKNQLNMSLPFDQIMPAPFNQTVDEFELLEEESTPRACEFPQNLLHPVPNPQHDEELGAGENSIKYSLRKEGTRAVNPVIEDSHGHTYGLKRKNKGKVTRNGPFQCIKRKYKGKNNCKNALKIVNFEAGENEMVVYKDNWMNGKRKERR